MKLTFKKERRATGLLAVAHPYPDTSIKIDGKVVGYIGAPDWQTPDNCWTARIALLKTRPEGGCPWRWASWNKRFRTEEEARVQVAKTVTPEWLSKHAVHFFED